MRVIELEISRFPCKERPYMPGSQTTQGRSDARAGAPARLAFRDTYSVGTLRRNTFAAQWLAYTFPCRRFADILADTCARLGVNVDRYSFMVSRRTSDCFYYLFLHTPRRSQARLGLGLREACWQVQYRSPLFFRARNKRLPSPAAFPRRLLPFASRAMRRRGHRGRALRRQGNGAPKQRLGECQTLVAPLLLSTGEQGQYATSHRRPRDTCLANLEFFVAMRLHRHGLEWRRLADQHPHAEREQQDRQTDYAEQQRCVLLRNEGHCDEDAEHAGDRNIGQIRIAPHAH